MAKANAIEVTSRLLQRWTELFHDASATTDDFLALADKVCGEGTSEFFRPFLYEDVVPVVDEYEG